MVARDERGAAAVEFALVAMLLFMVLFGIVQFGIAYNRTQGLQAAAREGARLASIAAPEAEIAARVRSAQSLFTPADVKVRIQRSSDNGVTWSAICDDGAGPSCSGTGMPTPCATAGLGNMVRVVARVDASSKYAISLPGFGSMSVTYDQDGSFRCEKTS